MRHPLRTSLVATAFALGLAATAAHAQGAAVSLLYDPSIRAAGMGGAGSAVFWGGDANVWANPALLGYAQGLRFERGRTQLVPGLATDVWFDTERHTIGGGGLGVAMTGKPDGIGRTLLDYGGDGYHGYEHAASWSVGASAAGLASTLWRWRGAEPPAFTRYADLAFGVSRKEVRVVLAPWGSAHAAQRDWGLLARVTALDNSRRGARPNVPLRLDAAYAHSVVNAADATIRFTGEDLISPIYRLFFNGIAVRGEMGLPAAARSRFERAPWLAESFEPLLSLGLSCDLEHAQAGDYADNGYDVRHLGAELTVANLLTVRGGHLEDKTGGISGATLGWGLGFRAGRYAGFRYDYGTRPQASGLQDVKRRGWTAFLDIAALARAGNTP